LQVQLLLSLLNCHYIDPSVFSPSFYFLPTLWERELSEQLGGCLADGQGQSTTTDWYVKIHQPCSFQKEKKTENQAK